MCTCVYDENELLEKTISRVIHSKAKQSKKYHNSLVGFCLSGPEGRHRSS